MAKKRKRSLAETAAAPEEPEGTRKKRSSRASLRKAKKAKLSAVADAHVDSVQETLREAGRTAPSAGDVATRGTAARLSAPGSGKQAFTPDGGPYAFIPDPDDHCETDVRAYRHLKPLLLRLERAIYGKDAGKLQLWDPYYCNGAMKRSLASLGFLKVHNENEDFYEVLRKGCVPPHDVLVSSPPYSADHIERCMRHCASSSKPWCVLLPNWVFGKDYYQDLLHATPALSSAAPMYMGPVGEPYRYWFPEGCPRPAHVGADGQTTPYATCWYVHVPTHLGGMQLVRDLEVEQRRRGECVIAKTVKGLKWLARKAAGGQVRTPLRPKAAVANHGAAGGMVSPAVQPRGLTTASGRQLRRRRLRPAASSG